MENKNLIMGVPVRNHPIEKEISGVRELRKLANLSRYTLESVFDDRSLVECINILRALFNQPWDIYADHLTEEELDYCAKNGACSAECLERLEKGFSNE